MNKKWEWITNQWLSELLEEQMNGLMKKWINKSGNERKKERKKNE